MEKPDLSEQFGTRIGVAIGPHPEAGPPAWASNVFWETEDWWIICQMTGKTEFDWDFAVDCLGDEEEAGRFASFAKEFIPKAELDTPGFKSRCEQAWAGDGKQLAWWSRWSGA